MWRAGLLSFAICMTLAVRAEAQVSAGVGDGDRVRIQSSVASGEFTVLHAADAVLTLEAASGHDPVRVPFSSISRLEVHRGHRSAGAGALRGAGFGLLIGGGAGVVAGFASGDDDPGWLSFSREEKALAFGVVLGGLGTVIGASVGALSPGDRWQRIAASKEINIAPATGGRLALVASHRF